MYFSIFDRNLVMAISTCRNGGVSEGNYESLNLCDYTGDSIENVMENRRIFCKENLVTRLVLPRQTHSDCVGVVDEKLLELNEAEQRKRLDGIDALVTSVRDVCIGVSTADCVPILLHDEKMGVVAAVHAGWKGTSAKIVKKTVEVMMEVFGSEPTDIVASIGPCISVDSYVVGEELIAKFEEEGFKRDAIFERREGKWFLNLKEANRLLLLQCGLQARQIEVCPICTYKEWKNYFSARRMGVDSGRIASCIMLK